MTGNSVIRNRNIRPKVMKVLDAVPEGKTILCDRMARKFSNRCLQLNEKNISSIIREREDFLRLKPGIWQKVAV